MMACRSVNYVYDDGPKDMERWQVVDRFVNGWDKVKPAHFDPVLVEKPQQNEPFPRIIFVHDIHRKS